MASNVIRLSKEGSKVKVAVVGSVDEDVDFSGYSLDGAGEVEIDLEGVKSINSCGIREWIRWLSTSKGAKISYINCPKIIVDQINMVDGFLPANAKVLSFYVPYYSETSGEEKNVLYRYGTDYSEGRFEIPPPAQDSQGNEMEMDVVEAKYFKFLKR